jgi:hypothetical protein
MEDSPDEVLFTDLARKMTKVCFQKCVQVTNDKLVESQIRCIRDCVKRYLQCRETALETIKELARRE